METMLSGTKDALAMNALFSLLLEGPQRCCREQTVRQYIVHKLRGRAARRCSAHSSQVKPRTIIPMRC